MLKQNYYVIFTLHGLTYGIDATLVKEIFSLPELTVAIDAPDDVVGLLNLRGKLIAVMDLNHRFGYPFQEYQLSDSIIAIEKIEHGESKIIGIVVNQVREVTPIAPEAIDDTIYSRHPTRLIGNVAKLGTETIALINSEALLTYTRILEGKMLAERDLGDGLFDTISELEVASHSEPWVEKRGNFFDTFCAHSTPQQRQMFRTRAEHLMQASQRNDLMGLRPLAVVGLGDEYFGLDLEVVREFTEFHQVTPIPCCPDHVVGNINLRGEIVTLIDIRRALHMQVDSQTKTSKAIVVHIDDLVMGIPVERVFDVLYLQKSDIKPNPTATSEGDRDYLQGTVLYHDKMMGILNLSKIFAEGNLSVNEEV
ncbi:MAG: chemotaxis protein CheW [Pseudanabaena sp. ELA607]|jgi:purine-binding chemotaxis protein CheW